MSEDIGGPAVQAARRDLERYLEEINPPLHPNDYKLELDALIAAVRGYALGQIFERLRRKKPVEITDKMVERALEAYVNRRRNGGAGIPVGRRSS